MNRIVAAWRRLHPAPAGAHRRTSLPVTLPCATATVRARPVTGQPQWEPDPERTPLERLAAGAGIPQYIADALGGHSSVESCVRSICREDVPASRRYQVLPDFAHCRDLWCAWPGATGPEAEATARAHAVETGHEVRVRKGGQAIYRREHAEAVAS